MKKVVLFKNEPLQYFHLGENNYNLNSFLILLLYLQQGRTTEANGNQNEWQ